MRTRRALEAAIVVLAVEEVVVALRIRAQLRIILLRGEGQRRPARPAPDHLGRQSRLLLGAGGVRAQVLTPGRHLGVELPDGQVGAVAPQDIGLRHGRQISGLIGIAEDELPGLGGGFLGIGARNRASLDARIADAVAEAQRGASGGELVDLLPPDHLDAGRLPESGAGALQRLLQSLLVGRERVQHDVDVGGAERWLPVRRITLADVAEHVRPRRHALLKRQREAVERLLGHPEGS
jgi:hypothetical protein